MRYHERMEIQALSPARERVMEVLQDRAYRTIAGLAASAQVSRATVQAVLGPLHDEGLLDVRRDLWPNSFRLRQEVQQP